MVPRRKFTPKQITQLRLREARADRIIRTPLYQKAVRDIVQQSSRNAKAVRQVYKCAPPCKKAIKKRSSDASDPTTWTWEHSAVEDLPGGFFEFVQHEEESNANYRWWTDAAHLIALTERPIG
jgi:hypothetical protein